MTVTVNELTKVIGEDTMVRIHQDDCGTCVNVSVSMMKEDAPDEWSNHQGTVKIPLEHLEQFTNFCNNVHKMLEDEAS